MKIFKNLITTVSAYLMEIFGWIASRLPQGIRFKFVRILGRFYMNLSQGQRLAIRENLSKLLKKSEPEINLLVPIIFENFAITLYDFFFPQNIVVDVPDRKKLEAIREKHGGILILTFHLGHWELGARKMREWGWPVTAVYQEYTNKKFKEVIEKRRAPGVNFIPVGAGAALGVRDALKKNEIVAMLGDHPFGEEGVVVNLLGHRVLWPRGPVVVAVRERKPIVVALVLRKGPGQYEAHIEEALIPEARSLKEADRLIQEVATKFGKFAQQYPEQWYRFREFEYKD